MSIKNAVIIIPTYNEAKNIEKLIDYLFEKILINISNYKVMILIVDGNSPDNTANIVKEKMEIYNDLYLIIEEKKEGLGAAYIKGFKYAIEKLKADVVIEFDADFQHPPELIINLLKEINNGYDYVLASRNIKGGSFPSHWSLRRLIFSKMGGFFARFVLFFPFNEFFKITDPTTGLKATKVKGFLDKIELDKIKFKGFAYKIELLQKMILLGAKIKEIPLQFKKREHGESKLDANTPKEILKAIFYLRLKDEKSWKVMRFGIVGFSGYIVNSFFLELFSNSSITHKIALFFSIFKNNSPLKILSNHSAWAAAFSTELSIINNFILNHLWTFKSKDKNTLKIIKKFLKFNLVAFGSVLLQFLSIGTATLLIANTITVRQIALICSIIFLTFPYNWIMCNKLIWSKKFLH